MALPAALLMAACNPSVDPESLPSSATPSNETGGLESAADAGADAPAPSCPAGTARSSVGDGCEPCADGMFSTAGEACAPWTACPAGTYVKTPGSSASDRVCSACSGPSCAGVKQLSVGPQTCAVTESGSVLCWGRKWIGPAEEVVTEVLQPTPVTGISNVAKVATAAFHACAVLDDGTVRCWGSNANGELGAAGPGTQAPTAVPALSGITHLSSGDQHTIARKGDGTLSGWGVDRCGMGGTSFTSSLLAGLSDAADIASAACHDCVLRSDRTVECMQYHTNAGDEYAGDFAMLLPVSGLAGAKKIAAGGFRTCAIMADGGVRCRELDNGVVTVQGVARAVDIAVGTMHVCALLGDGTVRCWGSNTQGALGDGSASASSATPVVVSGLTNAVAIYAGGSSTCAILTDGTVRCWGANDDGQLGDGTKTDRTTPVAVVW